MKFSHIFFSHQWAEEVERRDKKDVGFPQLRCNNKFMKNNNSLVILRTRRAFCLKEGPLLSEKSLHEIFQAAVVATTSSIF